jgi:hypothetical protein
MDNDFSPFVKLWESHISLARQIAEDNRVEDFQHQIVALALHRSGPPFAYGVNRRRHSRRNSVFLDSLHSESDLIRRCHGNLNGAKVLLYRFNNAVGSPFAGIAKNAKPCLLCCHFLREAGAKQVIYIDDDAAVQSIRGTDLPLLTERPDILTRLFVERMGNFKHRNFLASRHLRVG